MIQREKKIRRALKISCRFRVMFCVGLALLLFNICFAAVPISVSAVELFLEPQMQEVGIIQQFQVDLLINTQDEDINAIEGDIIFPEELLELSEIRDGNSIINLWIERPQKEEGGRVVFSGIIPGGYVNKKGLLFSMVFQASKGGVGAIEIENARALLNDGRGTDVPLSVFDSRFHVLEKVLPFSRVPIIQDKSPPEAFVPEVARDSTVFEGKWFLVFATQDKGAGIDRYEIKEIKSKEAEAGKWVMAESPHLLNDQKLGSYIYVKAIDRSGNERVVILPPQKPLTRYENFPAWSIIILGIIIIFSISGILWKKHRMKKR